VPGGALAAHEGDKRMASTEKTDAITLLREDHRKVEDLFKQFEKASGDGRKQRIAEQICLELSIHSMIEEELFYPACAGKVDEDLLKESVVEYDSAKLLIAEIMAGGPDDEFYDSKVKVLQEQIEHHVEEEEQPKKGMFAQAREADIDMKALGAQLAERKLQLMEQFKDGLPKPELSAMSEAAT
jgi:hemerythrin superfamily protein